jgi:hypothetical protein
MEPENDDNQNNTEPLFGESFSDGYYYCFYESTEGLTISLTGNTTLPQDLVIPGEIRGIPVVKLEYYGFSGRELTSVVIPDSVKTIGEVAFEYNQLTSVVIGSGVKTIGSGAFWDNQLTSVIIPDSVETIGELAFGYNQLTSVIIGSSVKTIGNDAFSTNRLTSVIIPDSVETIEINAFINNQLTSIVIGNGVNIISYAFENGFDSFYNTNGKKAGTYTYTTTWSFEGSGGGGGGEEETGGLKINALPATMNVSVYITNTPLSASMTSTQVGQITGAGYVKYATGQASGIDVGALNGTYNVLIGNTYRRFANNVSFENGVAVIETLEGISVDGTAKPVGVITLTGETLTGMNVFAITEHTGSFDYNDPNNKLVATGTVFSGGNMIDIVIEVSDDIGAITGFVAGNTYTVYYVDGTFSAGKYKENVEFDSNGIAEIELSSMTDFSTGF